ncbi:superinfection immunity protein [Vibrio splendidus]|uniref:superinfection immunity protein n=1 Tax=Vibrio splendidus TaxID=29497 RepID=UPI00161BF7A6
MELIFYVIAFSIIIYIFLLPTTIARRKDHPHKTAIATLNIVGSLFFGTGWLIALVWSLMNTEQR